MKGKEFVVELVAGVEFEELVRGDDEGVCWGVLGNLKIHLFISLVIRQKERGWHQVYTYDMICQSAEEPAQGGRRLISLVEERHP